MLMMWPLLPTLDWGHRPHAQEHAGGDPQHQVPRVEVDLWTVAAMSALRSAITMP
jgi:glucose uptake protein GlcU